MSAGAPRTDEPASAGGGGDSRHLLAAVVVDYEAATHLPTCVASLLAEGADEVVVVENGDPAASSAALADAGLDVPMVVTGRNLGYGAGANRGMAATGGDLVLVCNADLRVHPGALRAAARALDDHPAWAIVGPRILDPDGTVYPSARHFPSMVDAAGHALLGVRWPQNRFSRRYRPPDAGGKDTAPVGWVSGACFLARRSAMEELGGFDECYFMFAEDMDLCWRARRAGWGVGVVPAAVVTHAGGVSRRHHPYRMLVAHHRSALRFAARTSQGWHRLALPLAAAVLGARLVAACASQAVRS